MNLADFFTDDEPKREGGCGEQFQLSCMYCEELLDCFPWCRNDSTHEEGHEKGWKAAHAKCSMDAQDEAMFMAREKKRRIMNRINNKELGIE